MRHTVFANLIILFTLSDPGIARAGLGDWLDVLKDSINTQTPGSTVPNSGSVTQSEMIEALKQALDQGVQHAVQQLGQPGGFLDDARVRIPMPDTLAWADKTLRAVGQTELADQFVQSMNHAAEQAVPEVATVFGNAIRAMTLDDARGILNGPDDAATEYFRTNSSAALAERMKPIIKQATGAAGVTSYYKSMMNKVGGFSSLLGQESVDLDAYVTDKAMDGLFLMIAEQEKLIRENPLQRSTELLQKVFGTVVR
jgi:hypothetical protein